MTREVHAPGPGHGPAPPPAHPRVGAIATLARLPADLVVGLGYTVRELPHLVQDLRSLANDLARLAHGGHTGALGEVVGGLARTAGPDGELTDLVRESAGLAADRAQHPPPGDTPAPTPHRVR